jgi:hypothetical protein
MDVGECASVLRGGKAEDRKGRACLPWQNARVRR